MSYYNGTPNFYAPYQNAGAMQDILTQYKGPYQPQPMMQHIPMTPSSDMIWVLSEGEAQSYPVAPNNSVILWDKNSDVVYIKSVNAQNVPSFRVLDYKERSPSNAPKTAENHVCKCGDTFVSKEEYKTIQEELAALKSELNEIKGKINTTEANNE